LTTVADAAAGYFYGELQPIAMLPKKLRLLLLFLSFLLAADYCLAGGVSFSTTDDSVVFPICALPAILLRYGGRRQTFVFLINQN